MKGDKLNKEVLKLKKDISLSIIFSKKRELLESFLVFIVFLLLSGVVTGVIGNPFFTRMVGVGLFDYIFLFTTSLIAASLYFLDRLKCKNCLVGAPSLVLGLVSYSCPICSKLVLLLLGSYALALDPFRPFIGIVSLVLFGAFLLKILPTMKSL